MSIIKTHDVTLYGGNDVDIVLRPLCDEHLPICTSGTPILRFCIGQKVERISSCHMIKIQFIIYMAEYRKMRIVFSLK